MQSTPGRCQVPIHTVTLDVQDHEKTQQLPTQLPKDFQEVTMLSASHVFVLHTSVVRPCKSHSTKRGAVRLYKKERCHAAPDLLDACRLTFY